MASCRISGTRRRTEIVGIWLAFHDVGLAYCSNIHFVPAIAGAVSGPWIICCVVIQQWCTACLCGAGFPRSAVFTLYGIESQKRGSSATRHTHTGRGWGGEDRSDVMMGCLAGLHGTWHFSLRGARNGIAVNLSFRECMVT